MLIDAIDEVTDTSAREHVLLALAGLVGAHPRLRLVITMQPVAYTGVRLPGALPMLPLAPMDEADARRLVSRWSHRSRRFRDHVDRKREHDVVPQVVVGLLLGHGRCRSTMNACC